MDVIVRSNSVILKAGLNNMDYKIQNRIRDSMFSKITTPKWYGGVQRFVSIIDRYWYAGSNPNTIIHINRLGVLGNVLKDLGLTFDDLVIKKAKRLSLKSSGIKLELKDKRLPRIHQKAHIEDFFRKGSPFYYLLSLKPGYGKTFTAIKILDKLQQRTIIVVLSKYVDMWDKELRKGFFLEEKDVYKAIGHSGISKLFKMNKEDLPKFIIMPTRTLNNYMELVSKEKRKGLPPTEDFAKCLNVGNLVIDEGHNEFHVVYKFILNLDVRTLLLSGTFISKSKYIRGYMEELFPKNERKDFSHHKSYVNFHRVIYNLNLTEFEEDWVNANSGYSSNKYESLLLGNARNNRMKELDKQKVIIPVNGKMVTKRLYKNYNNAYRNFYLDMIINTFRKYFVNCRKKDDKIIIYHSLVNSCSVILDVLSKEFPKLKMVRYTMDDKYEDIISADVIISTVLSSGEAFDIPNLTTIFMFINTVSEVSNLQASGRLRDLKGKDMNFYYFINGSISKHKAYDIQRTQMFRKDAKTYNTIRYKE